MILGFARVSAILATLPERFGRPVGAKNYLRPLDGLRALSIAIVLIWHGGLRGVRRLDTLRGDGHHFADSYALLPHGEIGVCLFFVISGFVIGLPFLKRAPRDWALRTFWMRRARRIYPPYLAALALCVGGFVLTERHAPQHDWASLGMHVGASLPYLHSLIFDDASPFDPPMWSLEAEIQFYLLAPLILFLYRFGATFARRAIGMSIACAALVGVMAEWHAISNFDVRLRWALPAHLQFFAIGIVMADLSAVTGDFGTRAKRFGDRAFAAGLVGLLLTGLTLNVNNMERLDWLGWVATVAALSATSGAMFWGALHGRLSRAMLGSRWACFIGAMSYSIYLVHVPVLELLSRVLLSHMTPQWQIEMWAVWGCLATAIVLLVAFAFYVLVEYPLVGRSTPLSMGQLHLPTGAGLGASAVEKQAS